MKNILFIDDDPHFLDGLRALMRKKRNEWEVSCAKGGEEGLAMLEEKNFDIVISDMRMPKMNGAQVLEAVQQRQPGAVRVIFSGYSELSSALQAARTAHQFLSKPCPPDQLIAAIERIAGLQRVLTSESVRRCVASLNALPVLPGVYAELIEELQKPEPSMARLSRLVAADVNIYATLLKMVNSAFFGLPTKITTPDRVITFLGTDILKGLILGANVLNQLEKGGFTLFSLEGLWEHCFRTAQLARAIAQCESNQQQVHEDCFSAGLLHDLGKFILAQEMSEQYTHILSLLGAERSLLDIEREELGVSHAEIGGYLLGLWGIGLEVVHGVYEHHSLANCAPGFSPALAVHVADWIDHQMLIYNTGFVFPSLDRDRLAAMGFADRIDVWWEACTKLSGKWS